MIQHVPDKGCLDSKIGVTHVRSGDLPTVKGWRYIVSCEGLQDDKKAKHLFESVGQQRSDGATYFGNRLVGSRRRPDTLRESSQRVLQQHPRKPNSKRLIMSWSRQLENVSRALGWWSSSLGPEIG